MRNIPIILRKEFRQIFRDKAMLPMMLFMPIIQLIILASAATFEIKNLNIFFIDKDQSTTSRLLLDKFKESGYFKISGYEFNYKSAEKSLLAGKSDLYIEIPQNFESTLIRENMDKVQLTINAIDGTKASLAVSYSAAILTAFNTDIMNLYGVKTNAYLAAGKLKNINIRESYWYNPELNFKHFMVPGLLALLVTLIGGFLSSLNIVKEKEIGTMEQINVTPIKKYEFLMGKLIPFWVIGLCELAFGLALGYILYGVPFVGSFVVLFSFASIYLIAVLGIGLLISTITSTQQQAMFITWFFIMIFILLSGLFTAIENMPMWTQYFTYINPIRYFIEVIRMVMLKGSGFSDISNQLLIISAYAIVINTLAVLNYKKTN